MYPHWPPRVSTRSGRPFYCKKRGRVGLDRYSPLTKKKAAGATAAQSLSPRRNESAQERGYSNPALMPGNLAEVNARLAPKRKGRRWEAAALNLLRLRRFGDRRRTVETNIAIMPRMPVKVNTLCGLGPTLKRREG